jgi:hypothetical protein
MCLLCVYVCVYLVWCGGVLSLSLWIVAGMAVVWQNSRGVGVGMGPGSNCGDADELEGSITGQGGSYLPRYPSTPLTILPLSTIMRHRLQ